MTGTMPMRTELLKRRPCLAAAILVASAVAYWLLCQPAIWTRGYPQLDPFWQVMPWLWVFPVVISGVFDDDRRRRRSMLLLFAVVTGFVDAGTVTGLVPRGMSFTRMFFGTVFWAPVHCGVVLLLERLGQRLLRKIRRFNDDDRCSRCGYLIRYLTVARCPECGTAFDERWLTEDGEPLEPTRRPWRTLLVLGATVFVLIMIPPVYERATLSYASQDARAAAKRDWTAGEAGIYVDQSRTVHLSLRPVRTDPFSGLPIRFALFTCVPRHGLERETWQRAYNEVIEERLAQEGEVPVTRYIFRQDELEKILRTASLRDVDEVPFDISEGVRIAEDDDGLLINGQSVYLDARASPRKYVLVDDPSGLMLLLAGNEMLTLHSNGTLLQYATVESKDGSWKVVP
jgi:hypothetical protein